MTNTARNVILNLDLWPQIVDAFTAKSNLVLNISNPTNGTISFLADGHTVRFIPSNNFTGRATFTYSVADLGEAPREYFHYSFEPQNSFLTTGSIYDFSANNRPGSVVTVGAGTVQFATATPTALGWLDTQSLRLTETGDGNAAEIQRLVNPLDLDLNSHDWTFACWFNRATSTNDDFIFHLGTGNGFGGEEELQLWCPANQNTVGLYHWNGTNANMGFYSGAVVSVGQWNHVAVTYACVAANTGNVSLYLNGVLAGTATNVPFNLDQSYPAVLGGHPQNWTATSRWFNGSLDEAVLFKAALTSAEVARLATNAVVRFGGLKATNTVNILVGATAPQIAGTAASNGQLQLSVTGATGFTYIVEASTNLATWNRLLTTNPSALPFVWKDAQMTNFLWRFYRVLLQ